LCPQCGHNLGVGKYLGEPDHAEEVPRSEPPPELLFQLCTQCGHNLFPILRAFFLQDVLPDALAHVPVKRGKPRVHRASHAFTGLHNQFPHVRQQYG